ncbi:MAG: ABC transporter ATP-binding protein [Bacteroidota bacterium]|nr:ABC transporter ATP-binding protein [Bacteroidota bacterium]
MEDKEILVEVENVSKRFCKDFKRSIRYGFMDSLRALRGKNMDATTLRKDEFWSVKDISFQLRRGECLGLIGHNGAGKSTLLKMLNGLITPDHGKIVMRGKIGALIELGAGFSPILTGRENIYNNAAVLGFSKEEIDARFQDIIDFSEIGEFLDMPVQNYSSGMKVRLGFAVASFLNPDVLLVDEVLAVGDLGFVLKCYKQIDRILPNTAVIFVSHSMPMISRVCNEIILMEKGHVKYQGKNVGKGIEYYYSSFLNSADCQLIFTDDSILFKECIFLNTRYEKGIAIIDWNESLEVVLTFENKTHKTVPVFKVIIYDKEQREVAVLYYNKSFIEELSFGEISIKLKVKNLQLSNGLYSLSVAVLEKQDNNMFLRVNSIAYFQINHYLPSWTPFLLDSDFTLLSSSK